MREKVLLALRLVLFSALVALGGLFVGWKTFTRQNVELSQQAKGPARVAMDPSDLGLPVGTSVGPVELVNLSNGNPVELFAKKSGAEEHEESAVVLVFFSARCPGCVEDLPYWRSVISACTRNGVRAYLVTCDADLEETRHFVAASGFADLPVLRGKPNSRAAKLFHIDFVPTTYVFRMDGELLAKWVGLNWVKDGKMIPRENKALQVLSTIGD